MKISIKQLKSLITESMNDLEKIRDAKKAAGRLQHDPAERQKRELLRNALKNTSAERLLKLIVGNNSIKLTIYNYQKD